MLYQFKTKFRQALEPEFGVKVGQLVASYPHEVALQLLYDQIQAQFTVEQGLIYSGEAEALILAPLCEATRSAISDSSETGHVVRAAYQTACAYAIIADIARVSTTKDISLQLTNSAVLANPVYVALKTAAGVGDNEALKDAWRKIDEFLSDKVASASDADKEWTPLSLLIKVQAEAESSAADIASNQWTALTKYVKMGKGRPVSKKGAEEYIMTLNCVWNHITVLKDRAILEARSGNGVNASFADAWTAMLWFGNYLKMRANYDSVFPTAIMQQQTAAWVLSLRNEALKLKSFYASLSRAAQSFDMRSFSWMWDEQFKFLEPALPHELDAVTQLKSQWARLTEEAGKCLDPTSAEAAADVLNQFKGYLGVDVVVPTDTFQELSKVADTFVIPSPNPTKDGIDYVTQVDTLGIRDVFSGEKTTLLTYLTTVAAQFEMSLHYLTRSLTMLSAFNTMENMPLHEMLSWAPRVTISTKVGDYAYADFKARHPLAETMLRYTGSPADSYPMTRQDVLKPTYLIPLLQQRASSAEYPDEARLDWDVANRDIGLDIITTAYARQPIPTVYTWHRNSRKLPLTIEAYETIMRGIGGLQDTRDTFWETLASTIWMYRTTFGYSVLDSLAAVMTVYAKGDLSGAMRDDATPAGEAGVGSSGGWRMLYPRVPLIYGMPAKAMLNKNEWKGNEHEPWVKIVTVTRGSLKAEFAFALHRYYPKVGPFTRLLFPIAPGSYTQVAMRIDFMSDDVNKALGMHKRASSEGGGWNPDNLDGLFVAVRDAKVTGNPFVEAKFLYPSALLLPHLTCNFSSSSDLLRDDAYKKAEILRVLVKYVQSTGQISVLTVVDNPIQVLSMAEYEAELEKPDPEPIVSASVTALEDKPDPKPEVPGSTAEPAAAPVSVAPAPVSVSGDGKPSTTADEGMMMAQAGAVSESPILKQSGNDEQRANLAQPKPGQAGTPLSNAPVAPLSGDAEDGDHALETGAAPAQLENPKFWKLVKDGKIVDVVAGDSAPAGYVPATKEEFESFAHDRDTNSES